MDTTTLESPIIASQETGSEVTTAVETLITETAETVVTPAVKKTKKTATKKTSKKPAPKTKKTSKKVAKVEVIPEVKPEVKTTAKISIDLKALVMPETAAMKIMGTCTKFTGKNGHGYLKGLTLEISNPIDSLKDRFDLITKAQAEKYHLGKSKAFIRKIKGTAELQTILDLYFA